MPLDLDDVLNDQRWVPVEVGDHTFNVAYRPSSTSLRRQAELSRMQRAMKDGDEDELELMRRVASVFCEIVTAWDMTRAGRPLPVSAEVALDLPSVIYDAIMEAVTNDRQNQRDEKKALKSASGAISAKAERLEPAQNGIPQSERRGTWA